MPMTALKLSNELQAMTLYGTEPEAIDAWTTAFANFFYDASCGGIPVNPLSLNPAKAAMALAMVGMSLPGGGALAIQNGITAFWGALVATPPLIFTGITVITPPPPLVGLAALLVPVFLNNMASSAPKPAAMAAIAAVIYTCNLGGTGLIPPIVTPII